MGQSKTSKKSSGNGGSDGAGDQVRAVEDLGSRVEQYRALAKQVADGVCVMRPRNMTGHERRMHVRNTILEDHEIRIAQKSTGAEEKFEKLAGSLFSFFRGTSLLFHRDLAGEDSRMPTVLVLGDVHPENFGVMPNADNVPIFGVNDFDDVSYGPFTWDLKRGATGFMLAAAEEGGHGRKRCRKIAKAFLKGYFKGMAYYAETGTESSEQMRPDNSPKVICRLFEQAEESRKSWLWDRYLDESGRGFRANHEFTPISSRVEEFQGYIDALAKKNDIKPGGRAGDLKVKDVCLRHGQGTASLGLPRFYVLLEGPSADATDDLIIEFKKARRSALEGLVPEMPFDAGGKGDRIEHGQGVHLVGGDVFYGSAEIDGDSFMSRERAPFRDDIDLDDLSKKSWKSYAKACGRALAHAHARSDDAGQLDYDIEPRILEAMMPRHLFFDDVVHFAEEAVERLERDHECFVRDYSLGAFERTLKRYR
ncbi:DUF2252 domain-containing protein [Litorisediminicola beolgyonensis]|uniref:DUF2252 domain-containing protein n=1 Tax=Litorisediminicola beolgyonensis TaxID=1173614 RepID=A0ABW3ZNF4_9RHOB